MKMISDHSLSINVSPSRHYPPLHPCDLSRQPCKLNIYPPLSLTQLIVAQRSAEQGDLENVARYDK